MNEVNTVTISVDEYFELRQKADMNMTVLREIAGFENRLNEFNHRLNEFSDRFCEIRRKIER